MTKRILKYRFFIVALISTLFSFTYFIQTNHRNWQSAVDTFEKVLHRKIDNLDDLIADCSAKIKQHDTNLFLDKELTKSSYFIHVFDKDSLIFWNTNQLPISRYADIHFPASGILHLQNGWYYSKSTTYDNYTLCASFLLKNDYPYENNDLVNAFDPSYEFDGSATITLDQENDYKIYDRQGEYLFSLEINDLQPKSEVQDIVLLVLLLTNIGLWLFALYKAILNKNTRWKFSAVLVVLLMRYLSLEFNWFSVFSAYPSFDASLYATSFLFPNFFAYLLNCLLLLFFAFCLKELLIPLNHSPKKSWLYILLLLPYLVWNFLHTVVKGVIENSSIPLRIENLFSLNYYSLAVLFSFALMLFVFYKVVEIIVEKLIIQGKKDHFFVLILSMLGIVYFIVEMMAGLGLWFIGLYPSALITFVYVRRVKHAKQRQLAYGLLFIGLAALVATLSITAFNIRKEQSERELYASQLASEEDILTEIEYAGIVTKLERDRLLQGFINNPLNVRLSELEEGLENRIFKGFWEKYELGFNVLDSTGQTIFGGLENVDMQNASMNEVLEQHGQVSQIDKRIFYIADHFGQYSYIIKQPLARRDGQIVYLYITLKSKRIPEEIGYPRLLISSESNVFNSLENYSIARYYNRRLVVEYGEFNFPTSLNNTKAWKRTKGKFYTAENYSHFILSQSAHDVVILSIRDYSWKDGLTSFSYLFCLFGLLFIPSLLRFQVAPIFRQSLSLAVKIQFMLIALVFITLVAFSIGSGAFVSDQYTANKKEEIRAKLSSIEMEMKNKIGHFKVLDITTQGNYLALMQQKLSTVFKTDINLYDVNGFLVASSRPKVFNKGLISEQMNSTALSTLKYEQKSTYIQQEQIGKLTYASAYQPFFNKGGKLLGYINLQQFGQQQEFVNQIQKYLEAIINVFMLLLAISVVLALFISNWVTAPLKQLHQSLTAVKFGTHNQPIFYDKEDEIGLLVKDYNKKLEELESTALQLAKSERETAWREMAKQVAHEIKNPLTPMKLSVQQLLRVYDPNDPASHHKLERTAQSIIEQIDGLTKIANEFSNFAKMPMPEFRRIDLLPLIDNVIEVFKQDFSHEIYFKTSLKEAIIYADKEQMIRVLNNLLKNAIQSIPDGKIGIIHVLLTCKENVFFLQVEDNGSGIAASERNKIFVPYFTTKSTGTGLGLAMVKQIIENHRGSIGFISEENKGTTFTIELPMEQGRNE